MDAIIKERLDKLSLNELQEVKTEVERQLFLYRDMKFGGKSNETGNTKEKN